MSKPKKAEANCGYLREAFNVRRYHTIGYVAKPDTVGQHTVNMIAMAYFLYNDEPPVDFIKAVLHHDAPELATGDVPATAKWTHPILGDALNKVEEGVAERQSLYIHIKPEYVNLLKYLDMLELCFKGVEEIAYGNSTFAPVLANGLQFVRRMLEEKLVGHARAHELYALLKSNPFVDIEEFCIEFKPDPKATKH